MTSETSGPRGEVEGLLRDKYLKPKLLSGWQSPHKLEGGEWAFLMELPVLRLKFPPAVKKPVTFRSAAFFPAVKKPKHILLRITIGIHTAGTSIVSTLVSLRLRCLYCLCSFSCPGKLEYLDEGIVECKTVLRCEM